MFEIWSFSTYRHIYGTLCYIYSINRHIFFIVILWNTNLFIQGLRSLLRRMVDDWKTCNNKQRNVMHEYANLTRFIMTMCITLTLGNIVSQTSKQAAIYFMERYHAMANETVIKPTIVKSDFYFDEQTRGVYEAVFAAQTVGGFYTIFAFTASDGFFVFSMIHVCGQIRNLQLQIEDLVQSYEQRRCSFIEILAPIVIRHRDVRGYSIWL